MLQIQEDFTKTINESWVTTEQGNGTVFRRFSALQLALQPSDNSTYHNAQITDYTPAERNFTFKPPLRLTVTAFTSLHPSDIKGTMGFGFWNHPFAPGVRSFRLPQTLWFFFSSSPSHMQLAKDTPVNGFKVATMNAKNKLALLLYPLAPIAMLMMRSKFLYQKLWGIAEHAMQISELALDKELLTTDHTYTLEWLETGAKFRIDDKLIHETPYAPQDALGFIAWIDNQYAIVTPQGQLQMGITSIEKPQALMIRDLKIEQL
jgi:hypothetical protein